MSLRWYDERDDNDCDVYRVGPFRALQGAREELNPLPRGRGKPFTFQVLRPSQPMMETVKVSSAVGAGVMATVTWVVEMLTSA